VEIFSKGAIAMRSFLVITGCVMGGLAIEEKASGSYSFLHYSKKPFSWDKYQIIPVSYIWRYATKNIEQLQTVESWQDMPKLAREYFEKKGKGRKGAVSI
jgi:hypothetical protein